MELFAADGHDAGGCERVTGKSGMRPSSHVKELALCAFLHHSADGDEKTNRLKTLLADVHAGVIPDPDEELKGLLLSVLFPQDVAPSEVWGYLRAGAKITSVFRYMGSMV